MVYQRCWGGALGQLWRLEKWWKSDKLGMNNRETPWNNEFYSALFYWPHNTCVWFGGFLIWWASLGDHCCLDSSPQVRLHLAGWAWHLRESGHGCLRNTDATWQLSSAGNMELPRPWPKTMLDLLTEDVWNPEVKTRESFRQLQGVSESQERHLSTFSACSLKREKPQVFAVLESYHARCEPNTPKNIRRNTS